MEKIRLGLIIGLAMIAAVAITLQIAAAQSRGKIVKQSGEMREVSGEVMFIRSGEGATISVVYQKNAQTGDESEMLFAFEEKKIKLGHYASLKDISKGDIVRLEYEEVVIQYAGQPEERSRNLKLIALVKKGAPAAIPGSADEENQGVLNSGG
jgi:hypothetical protein